MGQSISDCYEKKKIIAKEKQRRNSLQKKMNKAVKTFDITNSQNNCSFFAFCGDFNEQVSNIKH